MKKPYENTLGTTPARMRGGGLHPWYAALAGIGVLVLVLLWAAFTHSTKELAPMETLNREVYTAILWEGREYVPWGMVSGGRGKQVGYVDGDEKNKVYAYDGQSPEQWSVNAYGHDSAMLYREKSVTEIPAELGDSEYSWNP